jgi:DNA-binding transcriptional LysR family regulator
MAHTDLTTLRLFLTVYRERNITRASEKEHIAPSAISRRISALEEQYNIVLFERGQSGVAPTEAAHALASYAQMLASTIFEMDENLTAFGKGRRGAVRIHCNSTALLTFVARDLRKFEADNPDIVLTLRECPSQEVLLGLREGHCEVGIFNSTVAPHDLTILVTRTSPLLLVMRADHPLAAREIISFPETFSYPFIALRESPSLSRIVDNTVFEANRPHFVQLRPSSFAGMREMVRNGFGIALMPEASCLPYAELEGLVCRPLSEPWAVSDMHICVRDEKNLSPAARRVVSCFL